MKKLAVMALALMLFPGSALAHTSVPQGELEVKLGWLSEPAFTDQLNAVQIQVTRDGTGVAGIRNWDVKVALGDRVSEGLEVVETGDGEYLASVIPTEPGAYTFFVKADGINVEMTAGAETFDEVVESGALEFPGGLPSRVETVDRIEGLGTEVANLQGPDFLAIAALVVSIVALALGLRRRSG